MPERPSDEAFAQHILKLGLLTDIQIKAALQAQAERALKGETVLLGEVLVQQGRLTREQRENLEEKLQTQREEAKRLGPYRIIKKLGEGGMGAVYLAEDADHKKVALKVLPKVAAKEEDAVRRFMREVDAARKLDHPNIVRAGASGEDKGFHYYVMEYVEGETLGGRLKRTEFLPPDEAAKAVLQIAHGLKYAHGEGFIHRDIKPDNVVVSKEGVAKILDMGLSKNIDEAQSFRTVTGVALGTPHYIAPEQARGDKGIDGRADIYSLGATYYHLVTGETPFHGTTAIELITQHLNKQIPDPRDIRDGIPDGVVHIIRRMMAKKPKDRYKDCGELLTDLELVVGGHNPSSQALDAAHSAVGLPMAREARERFRAQRRGQRPGTYRATTKSRPNAGPLVIGGIVAAVILVVVLAVAMSGGGSPTTPSSAKATEGKQETKRPHDTDPRPVEPAPRAKTPAELHQEEAQRRLDEIKEVDQSKRFAPDEVRRRYAEFAREYADTVQGKTIAGWLKDKESKPEEPKVAEVPKPESPKPDLPKPPEPAPSDVKPADPKPPEPASKPPAKGAAPTTRPAMVPADAKEFRGRYYRLYSEHVTWHEAKTRCDSLTGHLVTIGGPDENDFVRSLLTGTQVAWIGLTDEGQEGRWKWVTGDAVTFTDWAPGEPTNRDQRGIKEDFVGFYGTGPKWNDYSSDYRTSFVCEWEPTGEKALPAVPDAAKQREADAAYRKAFKPEQAKTPQEKAKLARALLDAAASSAAKDAELYVLLREARDLAAQGLDARTALEAIDARAVAFDVDAMGEKVDLFAKTTAKGADAAAWAGEALDVAQDASEADDYETAVKLAGRAEALARTANDRGLQQTANERGKELADLKRVADGLKGHSKTLETKPDDPAANAAVGRFVSLVKADWKRGLPMLAKGSETALKNLAELELANPTDAAAQAALGEAWAAQAEKETPTYKPRARERAKDWLRKAIPGLTGLPKVTTQRKLASLGPTAGSKGRLTLDLGAGVMMELVYIKPGTFTMGGTEGPKQGWQLDERPEHRVTITKGFYLGKHEVTQAQWEAVTGKNPSKWKGDDLPVESVSWDDCQSFLKTLTKRAKSQFNGRTATLPTEAQWEYACRAGTKTRWSFGDDDSAMGEYAWYDKNSGWATHAVGQKKPNPWGLYDMHGNVWEWCQDSAGPYPAGDAVDPSPSGGGLWCLRGGSWEVNAGDCRSSMRYFNLRAPPTLGLRVCVP